MEILYWICLFCSSRIQVSEDSNFSSVTFPFKTWSFALFWQQRFNYEKKVFAKIWLAIGSSTSSLTNSKTLGLKLLIHNPMSNEHIGNGKRYWEISGLQITVTSSVAIISSHCKGDTDQAITRAPLDSTWVEFIQGLLGRAGRAEFLPMKYPLVQ